MILPADEVIPAKSNTFFSQSSKLYEINKKNGKMTRNVYTCGFHPWIFIWVERELVFRKDGCTYPTVTFLLDDLYFPE